MNEEERAELTEEYLTLKAAKKKQSALNFCEACIHAADTVWTSSHSNCKGKAFCFCQHTVMINNKRYTYKVQSSVAEVNND